MELQDQAGAPHMPGDAVAEPPADGEPSKPRRNWAIDLAIGAGGLALVLVALVLFFGNDGSKEPEGLFFVIPKGAGATVNNSTMVSALKLPTEITFGPGEEAAISVKNEDSVPLRAGPFVVLPGQTYVQRFPNPGEFNIACTVDPAESITVTVEE